MSFFGLRFDFRNPAIAGTSPDPESDNRSDVLDRQRG